MLELRKEGLYCPAGDFFIDPWRPVAHAVITHAHSDHAKAGHGKYLCHKLTKTILEKRIGNYNYQGIEWNEPLTHNGVNISLYPAGHITGSSQIRIEHKGEVWVVSGDYKTENDKISGVFEPVKCNTFITESTFGLPIYKWEAQETIYEKMRKWVLKNNEQGFNSVFFAYSLGKAQRVADAIGSICKQIVLHGSVFDMHEVLQKNGISLPNAIHHKDYNENKKSDATVVIAPMSAINTPWLKKFSPFKTAVCSGWMQIRGHAKRQDADTGFVLSDHADWNGLLNSIYNTGADRVMVTHGFESVLSRYLQEKGVEALELNTFKRADYATPSESEEIVHHHSL